MLGRGKKYPAPNLETAVLIKAGAHWPMPFRTVLCGMLSSSSLPMSMSFATNLRLKTLTKMVDGQTLITCRLWPTI